MKYELPTIRSTMVGFANLASLSDATRNVYDSEITIHFSKCGFFDGNMASALHAVLESIADRGNMIDLVDFPRSIDTLLCRNQFLCQFGRHAIVDASGTTLPHKKFQFSQSTEFYSYLNDNLSGKGIPVMTERLGKKFRQSIFEIFQNCAMHSKSKAGVMVCGQFYPKEQHLDLTISDSGVGIRTNVREYLNENISSVDAIKWAMIEGNTTKTGPQPGGFGLKLLQEFIELNHGKVQIASRDGFYEFSNGFKSYRTMRADFPGTTINFQINTSDTKSYRLRSEVVGKAASK
jgi:hypothetical protein